MPIRLCPAQEQALAALDRLPPGSLYVLHGGVGAGKTTVLRELHRLWGGALLTMAEFVETSASRDPMALEESFYAMLRDALSAHAVVILDDLDLVTDVALGNCPFYPRRGYLNAPLSALTAYASSAGKRLVFGSGGSTPGAVRQRSQFAGIPEFQVADYTALCQILLGAEAARSLDCRKIHRFAPKLNAHQIRAACEFLRHERRVEADRFIDYLRSQRMVSNVDLGEVQPVDLRDLKGVDEVIRSLEANIVLPLENDALAEEMKIKPKRGVLLAGPPGTGKTTIGRALAHRLRGKFFLVDGTIISGTREFYGRIMQIFEAAKQNAPSIIFIDDSDVIFESGEEMGLYRYLLTMLDGLESESAGRVCVMMTAMDVGNLPPAMIRSGRIELWLETCLPDAAARDAILSAQLAHLPPSIGHVDRQALIAATDGFTGADLKRLVEDGKVLLAYDRAQRVPLKAATEYFLAATETVRANKERYGAAEARARAQRPSRPPWFSAFGPGMMSEADDS